MEDSSCKKSPFPEILKRLLKIHGMTLEDLGSRLGVTRQSVSQYVTGKAFPHALLLIQIAEIFDVSIDYLLTGQHIENKITRKELGLSERALEILQQTARDETHTKLSRYIDTLICDDDFRETYQKTCSELIRQAWQYPEIKRANDTLIMDDYMELIETRATINMHEFFQRYFKRVNIARSAYGDTPNEHFGETKSGWSGTNERNFASVEL